MLPEYTSEDYFFSLSASEYIRRFYDAKRINGYCKQCHNYNRSWACPPFFHDTEEELRRFNQVMLIATKIVPAGCDIPSSEAIPLIYAERRRLEPKLLEKEKELNGRSFSFAGSCLYCEGEECTRLQGKLCRHPELVRPSLEAYGFDVSRTASELFGIKLLWSHDDRLPDYLTLICGLFHSSSDIVSSI